RGRRGPHRARHGPAPAGPRQPRRESAARTWPPPGAAQGSGHRSPTDRGLRRETRPLRPGTTTSGSCRRAVRAARAARPRGRPAPPPRARDPCRRRRSGSKPPRSSGLFTLAPVNVTVPTGPRECRLGVLAFGDSITNGGGELQWGVALQSWALWVARALGVPFTSY